MSDGNPFDGLAPNLTPNPPGEIPEALAIKDAMASLSPFSTPQDVDEIIKRLVLDRPLKLSIPDRHKYPEWEFHIINSIPSEMADAQNKGWRQADLPELTKLFDDLVAGTDKQGKAFRPLLMARPRAVGDHIRKERRRQLQSLYAGMDPRNKEFDSKFAKNIKSGPDASEGSFTGPAFRIRV